MNKRFALVFAVCITVIFGIIQTGLTQTPNQKIGPNDRERAKTMLADMRDTVKKNYYDPTFHGIDVDARYKIYRDRVEKAETLADAFRTVAAFLSGLDDSHTFFIPPNRSYRSEYGYRMQMVGDSCLITEIRPETDAAQKLHLGDQVVSLNGFGVNRKDLWQLDYFLRQLAPRPTSEFTLRSPSGTLRKEEVLTKYIQGKRLKDLTFEHSDADLYSVIFEEDKEMHLLRSRYVEENDVMIWKLPAFVQNDSEVDHLMSIARKHKALIVDLRDNPGGAEATLNRMLGNVFDHEVKLGLRLTRKGEKSMVVKSRGNAAFTGDLVVLIDSNSASASELFARVIQLEHRGKVVGDRSSGSVMEAYHYQFQAGADIAVFYGASVTGANLVMTDGKSLEKTGVTPDVIILPTAEDLANGRDPALTKAAELVGIKIDSTAAGKMFPFEWLPLS
jgi:C-terminal processing protease CtpA/Prc